MFNFLVFSENEEVALELLSVSNTIVETHGGTVSVVGFGTISNIENLKEYGAQRIYTTSNPIFDVYATQPYAEALAHIIHLYRHDVILIGATKRGKELAPILSQKLNMGCVTDVFSIRVVNNNVHTERYTLGGNSVVTESIETPIKIISVTPHAFQKKYRKVESEVVELPLWDIPPLKTNILEVRKKVGEHVSLEDAEMIVAVGKGFAKKEDLRLAEDLAQTINAEIGCTRALATDYHWLSEDRVIGLSGRKTNPKLYIGIGISGEIQHTVGVLRSKTIVAINKNPDAPIFKIADYGIVGDLYKVLPKLNECLKRETK